MSILKKLHSRNFFILNLVLVGALMGFALAYTGFSFSAAKGPSPVVKAEASSGGAAASKDALATALAIQDTFRSIADNVLPSVVELTVVEKSTPQATPG
ncbi:MAG: serine protease, partial [Spirochaetota bacterium]